MNNQNLPNGIPPQWCGTKPTQPALPVQSRFNGLGSSHSSRDSSPTARFQNIPASQLPPSRQTGPSLGQLTQNYGQLSLSQNTPISSPKIQPFATSTPSEINAEMTTQKLGEIPKSSFATVSPIQSQRPPVSQPARSNNAFTQNSNQNVTNQKLESVTSTVNSSGAFSQTFTGQGVHMGSQQPTNGQGINVFRPVPQSNSQSKMSNISLIGQSNQIGSQQPINSQATTSMHSVPLTNLQLNFNKLTDALPPTQSSVGPQLAISRGMFPQSKSTQGNLIGPQPSAINQGTIPPSNFNRPVDVQRTVNNQEASKPHAAPQSNLQSNFNKPADIPLQNVGQIKQPINYVQPMATMVPNYGSTPNLYQNKVPPQPLVNTGQAPYNSMNSLASPTSQVQQANKPNLHSNRYPTMQQPAQHQQQNFSQSQQQEHFNQQQNFSQPQDFRQQQPNYYQPAAPVSQPQNYNQQQYKAYTQSVTHQGFNKLWGHENIDLLQCPNILPSTKVEAAVPSLGQEGLDAANCSTEIFRCTVTKIPESSSLLQKSRLPLGILIHPFKDLSHLPVIQCSSIVRCRACRTYINPFVFFVDSKRWKCNLCYRVNELPEEFQYDPVSKTYGDPSRRPEIKASTIEYIAPSEYMLRPPQPAVYIFLLDVSHAAVESGYLHTFCNVLSSQLINLPGDARTQIGVITYNSVLHFYSFGEGLSQPHEMTVLDIEDIFLPCPDNLVVNLKERMELVSDLLVQLPTRFNNSFDTGSVLGAALQAAHKMIGSTGGRITVFQAGLCTVGPGALLAREDPNQRSSIEVQHLNPANDFYKRLALECSGQQISVDLFLINSQYIDLATISGISKFSGGSIYQFPLFKASRTLQSENLERTFKRYLTRKIGFEAVMRIRCTRGLSIHTFHGNFFVRSTDLLSLPNINPDAGFGMQVAIDENLSDLQSVCFQAALLYTSSKGERRIRVHTLCLPICSVLSEIINSADQQCIVGLLAKMAVDRSLQSSLTDAREAFINVAIDILSSYKLTLNLGTNAGLLVPQCLRLLPLYISALLKHVAFRTGTSTRLDDRVKAMCDMKTLPLFMLIQHIYPDLYPIHNLEDQPVIANEEGEPVAQPPHLQLSARSVDSKGAYLLDMGLHMVIMVGSNVSQQFLNESLGVSDYNSISDQMYELPLLETQQNQRLNSFINYLNDEKPFMATLQIVRDNSPVRTVFLERLIEDRVENALSYHEFLQHLKTQVK